jgi:hypothetical protein
VTGHFPPEYELARTDPELDRALREAFVVKFLKATGLSQGLRAKVGSMFILSKGDLDLVVGPGAPDLIPADLTCFFEATGTTNFFNGDTDDVEALDTWMELAASVAAGDYEEELARGWDVPSLREPAGDPGSRSSSLQGGQPPG